ncbi:hypothetical protein Goarm_005174 [Gossypium armourianum]|uniref:Uncharacterized protein n=2 Tax=Gossypium armourianum TaxID=34283 RepID=A0A7J9JZ14_9ROSI|nr:hypothetical protein [Gossypium armourianum]
MLHLAFGPTPGPILFRRTSLRLSCGNMSPHKFKEYFMVKDYSMVKMDIDVCVANATVYAMEFDIKDAMGKASSDRHLALFAFAVYGLIVFPKALGYVSIELADFLLQIKKGVIPSPAALVETIISLNSIRRKGDGRFLGCA